MKKSGVASACPILGVKPGLKRLRSDRPGTVTRRAHSVSPVALRALSQATAGGLTEERRCASLSPSIRVSKLSIDNSPPASSLSAPEACKTSPQSSPTPVSGSDSSEKDVALPQCVISKLTRVIATKKREFFKIKKTVLSQQNNLLEQYAALKELESRAGLSDDDGDVRIVSLRSWPAHDILLLVRPDLDNQSDLRGVLGSQVLQQLDAHLSAIPDQLCSVGAELMARRIELLTLLRAKHRADRSTYLSNLEWKMKNNEFDQETERLHRMVAGAAENLKSKITYALNLVKVPWLDRDTLIKKLERTQKENLLLQHKIDEVMNVRSNEMNQSEQDKSENSPSYQAVCEELQKERAAREALKEVVSAAESMLRVARARIAALERQLKEARADAETVRRKHKELEQLTRHRETSYDARSKRLIEVSKTGEAAIEALQRQRDALELRVKELREQASEFGQAAERREAEQRARGDSLQAKVAEQEKNCEAAQARCKELQNRLYEAEQQLHVLREHSTKLLDAERRRGLDLIPAKENEPSDRETEIWKELQVTRVALSRAEEELRASRADKEHLLTSLSKIAQVEGCVDVKDKMAKELIEKEQKITKLQLLIEELQENEKIMENSMTQYENQLAELRLEVKRLRNYDCYTKEEPYQDLQTELLEMHMKVKTLTRDRLALVSAAASRALMLERHERAADLFAKVTRARRDLAALLDGRTDPPPMDEATLSDVSRSLSCVCATASDTWTALRAERARVLRLERAVLSQSMQLEREARVRTQLERKRTLLEREAIRTQHTQSFDPLSFREGGVIPSRSY